MNNIRKVRIIAVLSICGPRSKIQSPMIIGRRNDNNKTVLPTFFIDKVSVILFNSYVL